MLQGPTRGVCGRGSPPDKKMEPRVLDWLALPHDWYVGRVYTGDPQVALGRSRECVLKLLIWILALSKAVPATRKSLGECKLRLAEVSPAQVLASMLNSRGSVRTASIVTVLLTHQHPLHRSSQQGLEHSHSPNTACLERAQDQEEPMPTHQDSHAT